MFNKLKNMDSKKDYAVLISGFLGAVKVVLSAFGIELPQEAIDTVADGLASVAVGVAIWLNTYTTPKAKKDKQHINEGKAAEENNEDFPYKDFPDAEK
ncbi:hypothetical protein [Salsuginibacillus kocurii]|uniref:hypothetical protein n=1 Tax=Salsuginibacillus kocurii TaxID=427078 RepID=UPI000360E2C2|nr:hypothetical protein [Salsuginibacillus kocurii]